jgi:hypothetical protein
MVDLINGPKRLDTEYVPHKIVRQSSFVLPGVIEVLVRVDLEANEPQLANGVSLFGLFGKRFRPNSGRRQIFSTILLQIVSQVPDLRLYKTEPLDWLLGRGG